MNNDAPTIVQRMWNYCNLAAEIVEELEAALGQFRAIAEDVNE
jgi:hypothetical protein